MHFVGHFEARDTCCRNPRSEKGSLLRGSIFYPPLPPYAHPTLQELGGLHMVEVGRSKDGGAKPTLVSSGVAESGSRTTLFSYEQGELENKKYSSWCTLFFHKNLVIRDRST
jgi:hypothetical protein